MARVPVLALPWIPSKAHKKVYIQVGGARLAQALECVTRPQGSKIEPTMGTEILKNKIKKVGGDIQKSRMTKLRTNYTATDK